MSIVFSIPEVLTFEIVSKWIDRKGFARLDSATCNERERSIYFNIVGSDQHSFEYHINDEKLPDVWVIWIIIRSMNFTAVTFRSHSWIQLVHFPVQLWKQTESLVLIDCLRSDHRSLSAREDQFSDLIQSCTKLSSLTIHECDGALNLSKVCCLNFPIFARLTSLRVVGLTHDHFVADLFPSLCIALSTACNSLRLIELDWKNILLTPAAGITLILSANPGLNSISLLNLQLTKYLCDCLSIFRNQLTTVILHVNPSAPNVMELCFPLLQQLMKSLERFSVGFKRSLSSVYMNLTVDKLTRTGSYYCLNLVGLASSHLITCLEIMADVHLEEVILTKMEFPVVFSAAVDSIAALCPKVSLLQFNEFTQLASLWMVSLIQKIRSLHTLVFFKCVNMKIFFDAMCKGNQAVERLTVMNCPVFKHSHVTKIFTSNPRIYSIVSVDCPAVTTQFSEVEFTKVNDAMGGGGDDGVESLELKTVYSFARNVMIDNVM